ncbi:unnamed protein product [Microthlaspi erraticum]|uniref:MATH domain-containing protein n=1 Tax=Microthlaspi erraticum TaxID=1685480 RepID=A0A6D2HUD8_9BRAS|nr:unnamed protein product [Microthlaspi erraticum]CAA7040665.1 unnamed protein product [Microthlaspi erraticum]
MFPFRFVEVYPKGKDIDDHLSLFLCVANPQSLRLGWKRRASYSFVLLNHSGKELSRKSGWGFPKALPLKQLPEAGLEKNKLIVKVEVKVVEVVDQADVTGKETCDCSGFRVLDSQVLSLSWIFVKHPDFAVNVKQKNQRVKTTYINILLDLIETLNKPPHSISETELSNAQGELIDLTEVGFKLDWLKIKLDEVSLERKKSNGEDTQVQELEEHIKNLNLELDKEKAKSATSAAKVLSMEQTVSELNDEVLNLKDELNKEKGKSNTSAAKVWSMEQTVLDHKDELNKKKREFAAKVLSLEQTVWYLEDVLNNEKGKSDTCAAKVLALEQTVLDLKDELNKEKVKSAKVWSLEQTVWNLKDELNKEKVKSAKVLTLEQTVLDLKYELNKEKGVVSSWEVLDYA